MDAMLQAGHHVAHLDPLPIVSAMAVVTKSLSFAVTMSTSFENPYVLARLYSTLDNLTKGRTAWNIVATSWAKSASNALGQEDVILHEERYDMADEYMDVVYKLWESSWASTAPVWNKTTGVAYNPSAIKKITHTGKYFNLSGRNQVHPSPQRTSVLFQAGTSKPDAAFAIKQSEAFFLNTATITQAKKTIADARVAVAARGRDPKSVKFFPCIVPFIGRTMAEGREKYARAKELAVPIAGLGQLSGYTGIDMSMYPLDEPIALSKANQAMAIQSVFRALEASEASSGPWTPRRLGIKMALGRLHPSPVGSVEQVADVFEAWATEADCDGFNVASVVNPGSWVDVVELLVPELRKRGMYWDDYEVPVGTFKENLYGKGQKELREDHYGSKFKWGKEIEWDNKVEEYVVVPEAKKVEEEKGPSQSLQCCPYGSGRGSGVGK